MIYCQNCGVELEENVNFCSLCGEPVSIKNKAESDYLMFVPTKRKTLTNYQKLTPFQKRKIFWEIAGMILFSGILTTTTINLVGSHEITWSKYVITIGLVLFINITLVSFLFRKIFLLFFLSFLTSAAFISLLDIYSGNTGWVTKLGIPLLFTAYFIVLAFIVLVRKIKQKGLNLIAYSILASGLLCICINGVISIYTVKHFELDWSLIVMVASVFVSSLLLYLHGRLKKVTDLKRFFHL